MKMVPCGAEAMASGQIVTPWVKPVYEVDPDQSWAQVSGLEYRCRPIQESGGAWCGNVWECLTAAEMIMRRREL